jgi:hypothetical protein
MPPVQLDLTWTLFGVFCFYSLYTAIVSFTWKEKGKQVFRNLTVPVVVFIYFLVPCVALFLVNAAFRGVQQLSWTFVLATSFVLSISFVVMLYILTVPDWPIGKFTQIHKVPVGFIRALVSVNFGVSLFVAIVCGVIIVQAPRAIEGQGQGAKVQELEARSQELDVEKSKSAASISSIRAAGIRKVIDDNVATAKGVVTLCASVVGLVAAWRALGDKKKS